MSYHRFPCEDSCQYYVSARGDGIPAADVVIYDSRQDAEDGAQLRNDIQTAASGEEDRPWEVYECPWMSVRAQDEWRAGLLAGGLG